MKVLTIRQPWVWAIFFAGKDMENRTWRTHYRGPLATHAGARIETSVDLPRRVVRPDPEELTCSAIVGIVDVVDVVERSRSRWFEGPFALVLRNPRSLSLPLPCKGRLGLWDLHPASFASSAGYRHEGPMKRVSTAPAILACALLACAPSSDSVRDGESTTADSPAPSLRSIPESVSQTPAGPASTTSADRSPEYRAGHERGAAEALEQYGAGTAHLYAYGLPGASERLDRETGLARMALAGCLVDEETAGRVDGHNERLRALVAERGLPKSSRKRWDRELFDLSGYLASRLGPDAPRELRIGGADVHLSGGRVLVRMRPALEVDVDGQPVAWQDTGHQRRTDIPFPWPTVPRQMHVVAGPDGADVLVLRGAFSKDHVEAALLDLRTGDWLRMEDVGPGS